MGRRTQRIPSWLGATAPTKAAYICADQPVTFTFRLQQGGGPYIPDCRPTGSYEQNPLLRINHEYPVSALGTIIATSGLGIFLAAIFVALAKDDCKGHDTQCRMHILASGVG